MEVHAYHTLKAPAEGLYKEKGSKFIARAYPVSNEDHIKELLETVRKQYFDARHHCFAWMLGPEKTKFRAFDDGEPNHSAGDPILGQIRSRDLTDVLVIVIRYFGDTKLGVGGLISAYKAATDDALSKAVIIEREVMCTYRLKFNYESTPQVMKLVKDYELGVLQQNYADGGEMLVELRTRQRDSFLEKTRLLSATGTDLSLERINPTTQGR